MLEDFHIHTQLQRFLSTEGQWPSGSCVLMTASTLECHSLEYIQCSQTAVHTQDLSCKGHLQPRSQRALQRLAHETPWALPMFNKHTFCLIKSPLLFPLPKTQLPLPPVYLQYKETTFMFSQEA